jgi:hypothetical protein
MAMKIKMHAEARQQTAECFGNETRQYKSRPNVIYIKGPRDRLLMMTESVDQSFQQLPRDPDGLRGGRSPLPHERRTPDSARGRAEPSGRRPFYVGPGEAASQDRGGAPGGREIGHRDAMEKK